MIVKDLYSVPLTQATQCTIDIGTFRGDADAELDRLMEEERG